MADIESPIYIRYNRRIRVVHLAKAIKKSSERNREIWLLISYQVLRKPIFNVKFLIYNDASGDALGSILEIRPRKYRVSYASRTMRETEKH